MAKQNEWDKHTEVPDFLQKGAAFQLCQDAFSSGVQPVQRCKVQMDEYGFFLRWRSADHEAKLLDCNQIREICNRNYQVKDSKAYALLDGQVKSGSIADRIVIIVCGADMVNWSTFLLLADNAETAQRWITGLRKLIHNPLHSNISFMMALRRHWMKLCFMANRDQKITVKSITRPFSAGRNPKLALQVLKDLDLASSKNDFVVVKDFTFDRFYLMYQKICVRSDVQRVFGELTRGEKCGSVEAARVTEWLNEHQRDPRLNEILFPMFDLKRTEGLIRKYEPDPELAQKGRLTLEGFAQYLSSLENSPVFRQRLTVFEDMNQPLCHYSINSSHNTYLIGRQFLGDSSVEMYRQVLLSGCRCIELDCWDGKGENQGEPIITHGKAMCTDVNFIDVIKAINDTVFVTSDYPVILSFENHCSKPQQLKLAKYCEDVFGDKLLKKPLDDYPLEAGTLLPSPNALKRKIIIKNKRLETDVEKVQLERYYQHSEVLEEEEDEESPGEYSPSIEEAHPEFRLVDGVMEEQNEVANTATDCDGLKEQVPQLAVTVTEENSTNVATVEENSTNVATVVAAKTDGPKTNRNAKKDAMGIKKTDSASEMLTGKPAKSKSKKGSQVTEEDEKELLRNYKYVETSSTNIHPVLSSLINYCQSVKFQGFEYASGQNICYHMSSFSEAGAISLLKTSAIEFVNYNKRQLSRIYPRGNRVESSNYMPQMYWNAGCQMVSLNFQTSDAGMQLNQGRYEFNGMCGYLLKPEFMRREDRTFEPFSQVPVDGVIAAHCSIEVIAGLFLSDKQIGTYVEVDMYGLPTDTIRKEHRTKQVPSNGLNPLYNSGHFQFRRVILPNLAMVRFAAHDENGKLLGQRVIPLDALQCGYRYISLRSASGQNLDLATLFCNIVLKSYVPDALSDFVNALADPRKHLSALDMRLSQMRDMGIDEDDLDEMAKANGESEKPQTKAKQRSLSDAEKKATPNLHAVKSDPSFGSNIVRTPSDKDQYKSPIGVSHRPFLPSVGTLTQQSSVTDLLERTPVTVEMLTKDPAYLKMAANQAKEIEKLQRKLHKEKQALECKHKEKLLSMLARLEAMNSSNVRANSFCCFAPKLMSPNAANGDFKTRLNALPKEDGEKVLSLQKAQKDVELTCTNTYNETLQRVNEHHHQELIDTLVKALHRSHDDGLVELKTAQDRETSDLAQYQTKSSMMGKKRINIETATVSKMERDRILREDSAHNAKKFTEERTRLSLKHARQLEKMKSKQKAETDAVVEAIKQYVASQVKERSFDQNGKSEGLERADIDLERTQSIFSDSQCDVIAE